MSQIIQGQIYFMLAALCCGMLLMSGYDLLRFCRWLIPHGKLWIWAEDLVYWSLVSVPVFFLFFRLNDGILRWHGILMLPIGGLLYELGISMPLRAGFQRMINRFRTALFQSRLWKKIQAGIRVIQSAFRSIKNYEQKS